MGLHKRYHELLGGPLSAAFSNEGKKIPAAETYKLRNKFEGMMSALHEQKGATLSIRIMADDKVQDFINTHAEILDSTYSSVGMSDKMRQRLNRSDYIFSGMKAFNELGEAFPSLTDEEGNRKPFERFLNDVRSIDETYNSNYLRSEYNFVTASADMAAKWDDFAAEGDRYLLQYRTAGDDRVREEHAELEGVTLPIDDSFWESYYPPNGWNCRCTVVQVRRGKYDETDHEEAVNLGEAALQSDKHGIFRFNSGIQERTVPAYNPYTIKKCNTCPLGKRDNSKLAKSFTPNNEICAACKLLNQCAADKSKSQIAIARKHYLHEMEPLLDKSVRKTAEGVNINIGFTKYGNKHLYSDTFGRTSFLSAEDLKDIDKLITKSVYKESAPLSHKRNDHIVRFHYYEVETEHGKVRLNVAETERKHEDGRIRNSYFLYSVNDIKK